MELPAIMASLQLEDKKAPLPEDTIVSDTVQAQIINDSFESDPIGTSRLRKRPSISIQQSGSVAKKRCNTRTMNLQTDKSIEDIYLNKKVKLKNTKLETIFEEPKESASGEPITMSVAKQKRTLSFNITKAKKKKRKIMVKELRFGRSKVPKKSCRFSTADVLARLTDMMNSDNAS